MLGTHSQVHRGQISDMKYQSSKSLNMIMIVNNDTLHDINWRADNHNELTHKQLVSQNSR